MKILVTLTLAFMSLGIQAEELKYLEGEELVKYCQKDYWDCIAPASEMMKLDSSLKQNSPVYFEILSAEQAEETLVVNNTAEEVTKLSSLVLSKASKTALEKAKIAIATRVSLLEENQRKQTEQLEKTFLKISQYFEVMAKFSANYYMNLATITSPEVRESYVYSSHNQYRRYVEGLSENIKVAKKASKKLLKNNCAYRMNILTIDREGYCGTYTIDPFTNFEGLKFLIFNKEGRKSLPLTAVMVEKRRRSDAQYSKTDHKLTLYYYSWQGWGWYSEGGTASPSKEDVNKALGYELLK